MSWRLSLLMVIAFFVRLSAIHAQAFDPTDPEIGFGGTRYELPFGFQPQGSLGTIDMESASANGINLTTAHVAAMDPSDNLGTQIQEDIRHQPLIHIKVRVIEVDRRDTLSVSSVLDYFSTAGAALSLTDGATLNSNGTAGAPGLVRTVGATQFTIPSLIANSANGSGALINLTSKHVNWVANLLATELNADVVNAPQVTTLNGKNVQFRSGSKVPFNIGSNIIQPSASTIQQLFYKHVGLYISVTPQIVNWGKSHEGLGRVPADYASEQLSAERSILPNEISNMYVCLVSLQQNEDLRKQVRQLDPTFYENVLLEPVSGPFNDANRKQTAAVLNGLLAFDHIDRFSLSEMLGNSVVLPEPSECSSCDWKAADCTVNLNIAVRLSDVGNFNADGTATAESDVRAISNVVQVKSGHGVVMGGLISMRDVEVASKVPVLGDLPFVGFAFRSKDNQRLKTETIILVEAEVLPPLDYPENSGIETARSITSKDYCNGRIHLGCDLCSGFLADGMRRAGLAAHYLPPLDCDEAEYWQRYQSTVKHRRISTQLFDTFAQ